MHRKPGNLTMNTLCHSGGNKNIVKFSLNKSIINILSITAITVSLFISGCSSPERLLKTERDFQMAFNQDYFNGRAKLEVPVKFGRVDLLTDTYAIEVDRIKKFHEGIGQALHYAKETGKKPGLALFAEKPAKKDLKKLKYIRKLCRYYKIKVWFINDELGKKRD